MILINIDQNIIKKTRGTGQSLVTSINSLTEISKKLLVDPPADTYHRCLTLLPEVGLSEEDMIKAVTLLENEKYAIAFLALKGPIKLSWLQSKLREM